MSRGLTTALLVGAGLGAYWLYRSSESHGKIKVTAYATGAGTFVDYKNPADAMSDKRPAALYLVKPYQIFNPGGGGRPFEMDAQGQPTGREIQLPGEHGAANAIMVGADHIVDYQNAADARTDKRPAALYLVRPYQIFNPGGGIRPFEIDAQGQPTGRQLVLPGESPTVGHPGEYVMVTGEFAGQSLAERGRRGGGARAYGGSTRPNVRPNVVPAIQRQAAMGDWGEEMGLEFAGAPGTLSEWGDAMGHEFAGAYPYGGYGYGGGYGGGYGLRGGGIFSNWGMRRRLREQQRRLMQMRQQLAMQQQLAADQQAQAVDADAEAGA